MFGYWDVVICFVCFDLYIGGNCYIFLGLCDVIFLLWYWNGKCSGIGDNLGSEIVVFWVILIGYDYEVICVVVCVELGLVLSGL